MAYLAAAIDIGSWSLKVVLGKVGFKNVRITDCKELKFKTDDSGNVPPEDIIKALKECFGAMPQKPEIIYTALAGIDVFVRYINVPKAGIKRLDQIAPLQIEDDLPVEIEEYIVDAVPLKETGDGNFVECIVAAAKKDLLRERVERLQGLGLDPAEITFGPFIYSSARKLSTEPVAAEPIGILDIGHRSSELVLIEKGKSFFYRSILWGGRNVTEKIQKHFNITFSHAESIKEEYGMLTADRSVAPGSMEEQIISLCREAVHPFTLDLRQTMMNYLAKSGKFPQKLFLCGGTAKLKGIDRHIGHLLNVETETALEEDEQSLRFVRARALLGGAAAAVEKRINFRNGDLVYEGTINVVKRRWIRAVAFAAAVIIGWFLYSMAQISSLEKVIEKQHGDLAQVTKLTGEETEDFNRAELMLKKTSASKSPVPKADAFDILDMISRKFPEEVVHDVEEFDIRSDRWRIRGIVDSISDRDKIYEALLKYKECIKSISKGKTTLSVKDNRQKYNFDMEVKCP